MGLMAEFTGRTKTAIQTARSPGVRKDFSKRDLIPIATIGSQQTQSVRTMKNTLLASEASLLRWAALALAFILLSLSVPCLAMRLFDAQDL